jgi:lysine 6-dehydrogenase
MSHRYVVLGAGRQGVAMAYDLARLGDADAVVVADVDGGLSRQSVARLRALLPEQAGVFADAVCDVADKEAVAALVAGARVVVSAVPYHHNVALTEAAIAARASFCDLGGNTGVVRAQLARNKQATAAGVSVVPDCGLAPGLGNILAAHGVARLDEPQDVHVRCGGLPERPVGPLGYKLVFNFQGLINEYSGCGEFLRNGRKVEVPALTEPETLDLPEPLGRCEAAVTSGGTSTCAETFLGRLRTFDYKTVRYPGHFAIVRALFELGCFAERVELRDGNVVEPQRLLRRLFEERLAFADVTDLVVLRVTVRGRHGGRPRTLQYDLLDRHDARTGFSAMERTTAFPAALVAIMQARGQVPPGAHPPERALPLEAYWAALPEHDIDVRLTEMDG